MRGIRGKITIVTGAANGLGRAMAERLSEEGAVIIVADIDGDGAKAAAEALGRTGLAEAYQINLRENDEIEAMMDYVAGKYGRIDILVNNAGIQIREWATDFPVEKFDMLMDINLRAYYLASRAAARYMKKQGGGVIVCTSSGNSERFTTRRSPYNISKAAINGLVGTLAVEWGRFNIRINAVAPGFVLTDMVKKGVAEGIIDLDNNMLVTPMKRMLEPSEIASGVAFLASEESSGVTGQVLFIDAGWSRAGLPELKDI